MSSLSAPALLLIATATASGVARPGAALATLGDRVIREADFRRYLASALPRVDVERLARHPVARARALETYLDAEVVAARARQLGVDRAPRFRKALELAELKLLAHLATERYRERLVRGVRPAAEEVLRYYARHREELAVEPRFTARHVLVHVLGNPAFPEEGRRDAEARARAEEALARLRAGAAWDEVARAYSDDAGTNRRGGLIRDAQFGHFAPEVEQAVRTQPPGKPGEVVRSAFGYHVLQVEARVLERAPPPFDEVKDALAERIADGRAAAARAAVLGPISAEVGLRLREAGRRDAALLDARAVAPEAVLAEVGGRPVREADFRWFLEDALLPRQRASAYSRPGARRAMLASFLDTLVLATKARRLGLDRSPAFTRLRVRLEETLLAEFVQDRDGVGPPGQCGVAGEGGDRVRRAYLERLRAEVGLRLAAGE